MNAVTIAEWFRRQDIQIIQSDSSYWHTLGPRILQSIPYHWLITPSEEELEQLLLANKILGLRYSTPVSSPKGMVSYHVVYEAADYVLKSLSKKARYDVRKGLKNTCIQPIEFSALASEGWSVRLETLIRQGRTRAENQAWWKRLCDSASDLPGFEAWGAYADGVMAASLLAFQCDDWYSILYQQSKTEYLSTGVNNALTYAVTNEAIGRPSVNKIFYGLHSLDAPASVDEFKFRMGFKARTVRQRVVFHPALRKLFNSSSHAAICQVMRFFPTNPTLSKAEGMLRFYLQGNQPLALQKRPCSGDFFPE